MSQDMLLLLVKSLGETTYMVAFSSFVAALFGIPLGVILVTTDKGHILENLALYRVLGAIVNACRSVPFIILMVAIIPITRMIAGTSIGTDAAVVPLSLAAIPFLARIEAAQAMGASPLAIITRVLLPESMPSIISGLTLMVISLVGYSAMAGAIGGGGLGDLAIRYGYQRFRGDVMLATVVVLVAQVQIIQSCGDLIAAKLNKK